MKSKIQGYVADILTRRAWLLELIVVAIVLAIAIEFIAAGMILLLGLQPKWILATGVVLAVAVLMAFAWRLVGSSRIRDVVIDGFFGLFGDFRGTPRPIHGGPTIG